MPPFLIAWGAKIAAHSFFGPIVRLFGKVPRKVWCALAVLATFVLGTAGAIWAKRSTEPSLVTATKTDPAGNTSTASVEIGAP